MSTKNYDGFKMPSFKRVDHLLAFMNSLRDEAAVMATRMYIRSVVDMAVRIFDTVQDPHTTREGKLAFLAALHEYLDGKDIDKMTAEERAAAIEDKLKWSKSPLSFAQSAIEEISRYNDKRGLRCHYDFGFSIVIMQGRRKLLGIPYAQRRDFIDLLMSKEGVEEFGYWNNTDPPEGMSWSRFNRRGEELDEAWNRNKNQMAGDIPSLNGLTFEIVLNDKVVQNYQGIFSWVQNQETEHCKQAHAQHLEMFNEVVTELVEPRMKRFVRAEVKRRMKNPDTELGAIFKPVWDELTPIIAAFDQKCRETGSTSGWYSIHNAESSLTYVLEDRTKTAGYLNMKLKDVGVTTEVTDDMFTRYLQIGDEIEKELAQTLTCVLSYEELKTPIKELMKE